MTSKDLSKPEGAPKAPSTGSAMKTTISIQAIVPLSEGGYQIVPRVLDAQKGSCPGRLCLRPIRARPNEAKPFTLRLYAAPRRSKDSRRRDTAFRTPSITAGFSVIAKPLPVDAQQFPTASTTITASPSFCSPS